MFAALLAFGWSILTFIATAKFVVGVTVGTIGHKVFASWYAAAKAKAAPVITSIGSKV